MLTDTGLRFTKEEELELGGKVQEGIKAQERLEKELDLSSKEKSKLKNLVIEGEQAEDLLFQSHIALAHNVIYKIHRKAGVAYSIEDMAQDAYIGLQNAIKNYDPSKNCKFSTFGYLRIYKEVSISLNKMRTIRMPENKMLIYSNIIKAEAEYDSSHKDEPINYDDRDNFIIETVNSNLKNANLNHEVLAQIRTAVVGTVSLNAPTNDIGNTEFGDMLEDKDKTIQQKANDLLLDLTSQLTQEELNLLAYQYDYGNPTMTADEFMLVHGIDEKEMKRRTKKIITRLSKNAKKEDWKGVL